MSPTTSLSVLAQHAPRGGSPKETAMETDVRGLASATKQLADGRVAIYAYAYRGGPLVAKGVGPGHDEARAALRNALGRPETLAKIAEARDPLKATPAAISTRMTAGLVAAYRRSPEWKALAEKTRTTWGRELDAFVLEFGDWRTKLWDRPETTADLAGYRDEMADRPRKADIAITAIGRVFSWARGRGLTRAAPTAEIGRLSTTDRSAIIWTAAEIAAVAAKARAPNLGQALRLAALTGLRRADLVSLTWDAVSDLAITWTTAKTGARVVIPVLPETRALLAALPRKAGVATVLMTSERRSWTADGLSASFGAARKKAGVTKRLHDLRGTAATFFASHDLRIRDIARIMGWSEAYTEALMEKYVSADVIALDMLRRMKARGKRQLQTAQQTGSKSGTG